MKIADFKIAILRSIDRFSNSRGRINTFGLWHHLARPQLGKAIDFNKLYKKYKAALELLIKDDLLTNVTKGPIYDTEVVLTAKGLEQLEVLNQNFFVKTYYYFEHEIKTGLINFLFASIGLLIGYVLAHFT